MLEKRVGGGERERRTVSRTEANESKDEKRYKVWPKSVPNTVNTDEFNKIGCAARTTIDKHKVQLQAFCAL